MSIINFVNSAQRCTEIYGRNPLHLSNNVDGQNTQNRTGDHTREDGVTTNFLIGRCNFPAQYNTNHPIPITKCSLLLVFGD